MSATEGVRRTQAVAFSQCKSSSFVGWDRWMTAGSRWHVAPSSSENLIYRKLSSLRALRNRPAKTALASR